MAKPRPPVGRERRATESVAPTAEMRTSPMLQQYLEKMHRKFAKHEMSSTAVRRLVDESLGERTLTGELYRLRED